jgi:hypothetical protein
VDLGEGEEAVTKNILVFINHNTISLEHVQRSIKSLFEWQDGLPCFWDDVVLHNTHDQVSDDQIEQEFDKYFPSYGLISRTSKGPYKSIHQDLIDVCTFLDRTFRGPYRAFFFKADYCVSSNFSKHMRESLAGASDMMYLGLPIYNAKEWVSEDDIRKKLQQKQFEPTSTDTCYRGGKSPFLPAPELPSSLGKGDLDPSVKFIGHAITDDYNLHVFGSGAIGLACETLPRLSPHIEKPGTPLGWINNQNFFDVFKDGRAEYRHDYMSYGVHVFHAANRLYDMRKMQSGQRY